MWRLTDAPEQNDQRQMRRDEQTAGTPWKRWHFEHVEADPVYERLAKLFGAVPATEDTYDYMHNHERTPSVPPSST